MSEVKEWKEITAGCWVYRLNVQCHGIALYEPGTDDSWNPIWSLSEFISKNDNPIAFDILREVYNNLPEVKA